jgi:hypothetical protein
VAQIALEDLQQEFPDWIVTADRDFTGLRLPADGQRHARRTGSRRPAKPDIRLAEEAR